MFIVQAACRDRRVELPILCGHIDRVAGEHRRARSPLSCRRVRVRSSRGNRSARRVLDEQVRASARAAANRRHTGRLRRAATGRCDREAAARRRRPALPKPSVYGYAEGSHLRAVRRTTRSSESCMNSLAPCPSCKRHVRVGVASCPFCATSLPVLRARNSVPRALTRAAIFSAALAGCQTKSKAPSPSAGSATAPVQHVADDAAPAPVADAAEAMGSATGSAGSATGSAGSAAVADDAGLADAGVGSADALKQRKLDRLHEKRDRKTIDHVERQMAKPYGAPPARRRIV
jgi:hypothetical protein